MEAKAVFGLYKCRNCQKTHHVDLGVAPRSKEFMVADRLTPKHETMYQYHMCEDGNMGVSDVISIEWRELWLKKDIA